MDAIVLQGLSKTYMKNNDCKASYRDAGSF